MPSRRALLGALPALAAGPRLFRFHPGAVDLAAIAAHPGGHDDEDFWSEIALAFTIDRSVMNLNNGGVSPAPAVVQEAMKRHLDFCNSTPPPIALWQILQPRQEPLRERMARHWAVSAEEIAFTRNTSESLMICQFGMDLEPGAEVVTSDQAYPRMRATFRQRERREGIGYRTIELPVPCEDDDEVVRRFEAAITPKTRLILVSHMINLTGQILPVAKVVAMARRYDVPVIVDGAHALAHFPFTLDELGCDYYGTSLHKWLFAPHGTGLLYVRREKIRDLWPLMAADETLDDDIRKFEQIGTHPEANTLAIAEALTFHEAIGDERKAARLRYLRDRWARRLLEFSARVRLHTSLDPRFACGIATVQIEGIKAADLSRWLWKAHGILVTPITHGEQFEGIRVSPSVYTTPSEIDRFSDVMERAVTRGLEEN